MLQLQGTQMFSISWERKIFIGILDLGCINLDIHERTVPYHLVRLVPHLPSFQSIHLDRSFMEASGKPHNLSLQSTKANVPTPPFAFKTTPVPLTTPLPLFCGFCFCKKSITQFLQDRISTL
ncbi:hypothetical protein AVEN_26944-1 [Araneus ventricosus]|uniref:Uncharacterized protein n=1 Tax=Araneus ventricosus TaxID=182803 RepID=A0A4Y2WK52_ARAVE|nr:hypothetical protein AVEN_26944-1 [Araneus ventricosus]